jgi:hypothetical protein
MNNCTICIYRNEKSIFEFVARYKVDGDILTIHSEFPKDNPGRKKIEKLMKESNKYKIYIFAFAAAGLYEQHSPIEKSTWISISKIYYTKLMF